jgi:hypothetical protein
MKAPSPLTALVFVIATLACSKQKVEKVLSYDQDALRTKAASLLADTTIDSWTSRTLTSVSSRLPKGTIEWESTSPDMARYKVAITSGTISQISLTKPGDYITSCSVDTSISKETAIRRATAYLIRVAPLGNLELEKAEYVAAKGMWVITWQRYEAGLRFHSDKTWVVLRSDGSLANLKREMYSPMPDNARDRKYSKATAQRQAMDFSMQFWEETSGVKLQECGVAMHLKELQELVVRPNNASWRKAKGWTYSGIDSATRLAYVFYIESRLPKPPKRVLFWCDMEVWIDSETGDLLGYDYAGAFLG